MPILNPEKPKWISLTLTHTLFGALSGSRPVNWGLLIHEVVAKALPNIGKKPSFLSPFIFHLYHQYDLLVPDEEDELTIVADEVTYKLQPKAGRWRPPTTLSFRTHRLRSEALNLFPGRILLLLLPTHLLLSTHFLPLRPIIRKPDPTRRPRGGTGTPPYGTFRLTLSGRSRTDWRSCNTSTSGWSTLSPGANQTLDNCGPGNIIREIAKRADRRELEQAKKELEQVRNENAFLQAQVTAMSEELGQKSEELRRYHAEQSVAFGRIWELVGHPTEIVNKAHLYDRMMATGDPTSARQTLPILVKYSRTMKDLMAEIQKIVPLGHTPMRVLY